ncbi:PAS domain S-box-containing protein [Bradyrhizobium sp. AZCC 2289]
MVGTHIDVTEQHLAREALQKAFDEIKQSEDRLRLVIDTIPTLVWRAGPDGVPDFLNQTALDYTGLSLDQAETDWPRAFHPDDKKGMLVKWAAIWASGMPGGLEARLRRFDGEYRWFLFQAVPLRDESGNIVKCYGSSTDIEDRKRTEEALRESEQRFRDYAETASDWLWETGPDHLITRLSDLYDVGIPPSRLIGVARWEIATDVESEPEKWRLHRAMLDARQPFRNFVYTVGTGSPVYIQTSGKPFYDTNGNFLGYRGSGTNITASIRADHAEQALRKAQAELAHVTRVTTLGELTASIAHEVNQPLAAVLANAEACLRWLNRETPDLDEARRSVEWVIDDGNRASEVIRRVRALAKKTDIEKVPLDANEVVREVFALVRGELISHQVSVRTEFAPALPVILGDRVQLQQVDHQPSDEWHRSDAIGHGSATRTSDPIQPGRDRTGARKCNRLWRGDLLRECGPAFQRLLHHQSQRHGYGTLDLPFDHGSARWPAMGHGKHTPRGHVSPHPAAERRHSVVSLAVNRPENGRPRREFSSGSKATLKASTSDFRTTPEIGHRRPSRACRFRANNGHSGIPASRKPCASLVTSSSRRKGESPIFAIRWFGSSSIARANVAFASTKFPNRAWDATATRRADTYFGLSLRAVFAQESASSYCPAKK